MNRIFAIILPLLLALVNLFGAFIPTCETCEGNITVVCEKCNGEVFTYDPQYDLMIYCGWCSGTGETQCPDCSDIAKIYYALKDNLEENNNEK